MVYFDIEKLLLHDVAYIADIKSVASEFASELTEYICDWIHNTGTVLYHKIRMRVCLCVCLVVSICPQ